MKKITKSLLLVLMMVMLCFAVGIFASAATEYTEGYYTYTVENGEVTITDVDTSIRGDVIIPETLGGYPVINIGYLAFNKCMNISSITIPEKISYMDSAAFQLCVSLKEIYWNAKNVNDFSSAGDNIFAGAGTNTSGVEVIFGNTVERIPAYLFLSASASNAPNLTKITLGKNIKSIGTCAFLYCENINSVYAPSLSAWCNIKFEGYYANPLYYSNELYINNKLAKDIIIPDDISEIYDYAFYKCYCLTSVDFGEGTKHIGESAFDYCEGIQSVTIGGSVESIDEWAFAECDNLKSVYISDLSAWCNINFAHRVSNPFYYANNLYLNGHLVTEITIPSDVTHISDYAFCLWKNLSKVKISESVKTIGDYVFQHCDALANIEVSAENDAFSSENGVLFNKDKTTLVMYPIGKTSYSYEIPDSVITIADDAFYYCESLRTLTIPNSVTTIGAYAFSCYPCNLNTVFFIGDEAQWNNITIKDGNSNLTSAEVVFHKDHTYTSKITKQPTHLTEGIKIYTCPCGDSYTESVAKLEEHSYTSEITKQPTHNEEGIKTFTCACGDSYTEKIDKIVEHIYETEVTESTCTVQGYITYTCFCGDSYKESLSLIDHNYKNGYCFYCGYGKEKCGDNLTWSFEESTGTIRIIGSGDMYDYNSTDVPWYKIQYDIINVILEEDVTSIGKTAFSWCQYIKTVSMSNNIKKISDSAFYNCSRLSNITISDSVEYIGYSAFENCYKMNGFKIPDTVERIGSYAFKSCDDFGDVYIGKNVTYIGEWAFSYIESKTIVLSEKVEYIGQGAFANHHAEQILIPDSVKTIGGSAFCGALKSVTIPKGVTEIGGKAFGYGDSGNYKMPDFIIYGYLDTEAENYATNNELIFVALDHVHNYSSIITKQAQCNETGQIVYTCACGDTYSETIPATGHTYEAVVTAPTCTEGGYTTYTCHCNDTYTADEVDALGHNYVATTTNPTCTKDGMIVSCCSACGDIKTKTLESTGHSYKSEITTQPTHLTEGIKTFICACGDSYTEKVNKIVEHTYEAIITEPTCTEKGYTTYTCACGDTYVADETPVTDHNFDGSKCTNCGFDKADDCSCNCHKGGIAGFFFKIILFFQKLFRTNQECACGVAHY